MTDSPTTIFVHIPKTAGTTLLQIIARQYIGQPTFDFHAQKNNRVQHLLALPEAQRATIKSVVGHVRYGTHHHLPGESRYLTMIRDPRERLISLYYYAQDTPELAAHGQATSKGFADFLDWKATQSAQLDFIVGYDTNPDEPGEWHRNRDLPLATKLDIAERHLREHFGVVGLVEQFDTSLLLMRHAFGWRNLYYARRRVGQSRPRGADSDVLRPIAEEFADQDMAFYTLAKRIFEEQCAAYGATLQDDLAAFQRNNAVMGRVIAITADLRRSSVYRGIRRRLSR